MEIVLDERLSAVAEQVYAGSACDIGSDHGLLACALVQRGICSRVYACDIGAGPLAAARRRVEEYGLSDKVEVILSDGLFALRGKKLDNIIIAGMGGELIASILEAAPWIHRPGKNFILQAMTRAEHLRTWLYANGFCISAERAVVSGRFAYSVMRAEYSGETEKITELFAWTGKVWDNGDRASRLYLRRVRNHLGKMAKGPDGARYAALAEIVAERVDALC